MYWTIFSAWRLKHAVQKQTKNKKTKFLTLFRMLTLKLKLQLQKTDEIWFTSWKEKSNFNGPVQLAEKTRLLWSGFVFSKCRKCYPINAAAAIPKGDCKLHHGIIILHTLEYAPFFGGNSFSTRALLKFSDRSPSRVSNARYLNAFRRLQSSLVPNSPIQARSSAQI